MLIHWESCHIQNFVIFRILAYLGPEAYLESCLYRHIQVYSGVTFFFQTLILHFFQQN